MRFKQLFLLEKMSVEEAMKIMGLTTIPSEDELKQRFRELAKQNHPDRGGDLATMQNISAANDVLKSRAGKSKDQIATMDREAFRQAYKAKMQRMYLIVTQIFEKQFDVKLFTDYFENVLQKTLIAEHGIYDAPYSYGNAFQYQATFYTPDRKSYFRLSYYVDLNHFAEQNEKVLSLDKVTFNPSIHTFAFHDRRKVNLEQKSVSWRANSNDALNPEKLFPKKKISKIFVAKNRKTSKRDIISTLTTEFQGRYVNDSIAIEITGDYYMFMSRMTFNRTGRWSGTLMKRNGISYKPERTKYLSWYEPAEGDVEDMYAFVELIKTKKSYESIIKAIADEADRIRKKHSKEK